jgi:hypothetical protein
MTRVVKEALRERYERIQKRDPDALAADLRAISKRAAAHVKRFRFPATAAFDRGCGAQ